MLKDAMDCSPREARDDPSGSDGAALRCNTSCGVDDQLELARLYHRQVRRLGVLEDAAGIDANLTKRIRNVDSVAHQPADFGKVTQRIVRGNRMARREVNQLDTPAGEKGVIANEQGVGPLAHAVGPPMCGAIWGREIQSPASPAARARRVAMRLPRRREA